MSNSANIIMTIGFWEILVTLLNFLLLLAVPLLLEAFLATRKSKWPGLILPVISLLLALFLIGSIFIQVGTVHAGAVLACILPSIPPILLLLVYWRCRRRLARTARVGELDQMNIQDL